MAQASPLTPEAVGNQMMNDEVEIMQNAECRMQNAELNCTLKNGHSEKCKKG